MKEINCIRKGNAIKRKDIIMSIRVDKGMSDFMKQKNFSPALIFYEALRELGYKEQDSKVLVKKTA